MSKLNRARRPVPSMTAVLGVPQGEKLQSVRKIARELVRSVRTTRLTYLLHDEEVVKPALPVRGQESRHKVAVKKARRSARKAKLARQE